MNVPLVVDVLLRQPEYGHWSRRDAINGLIEHAKCDGLIWVSDENGNACLMLGSPRSENTWYVELMCSDSPELSLIALRNAVNKWSKYKFVAFERGRRGMGLRVYSNRFALRLAKRLFRQICRDEYS